MKHFDNCAPWRQGYYPFRPHTIQVGERRTHVEYGQFNVSDYLARYHMKPYATATDMLGYEYTVYASDNLDSMVALPVDIYGRSVEA